MRTPELQLSLPVSNMHSNTPICSVWSQLSSTLANLRSVFSQSEAAAGGLKEFTRALAAPAAERIGWEFQPHEDYLTIQLRKLLIGMAGNAGHEG